jgi:hypothetical protein
VVMFLGVADTLAALVFKVERFDTHAAIIVPQKMYKHRRNDENTLCRTMLH